MLTSVNKELHDRNENWKTFTANCLVAIYWRRKQKKKKSE